MYTRDLRSRREARIPAEREAKASRFTHDSPPTAERNSRALYERLTRQLRGPLAVQMASDIYSMMDKWDVEYVLEYNKVLQ